jgi:hypothetical protein
VPAKCGAADAHIDRNVEHTAAQDGHQFALRSGILEMQAAENSFCRRRKIILHEAWGNAACRVTIRLMELHEKAAAVGKNLRREDQQARNGRFADVHRLSRVARPRALPSKSAKGSMPRQK